MFENLSVVLASNLLMVYKTVLKPKKNPTYVSVVFYFFLSLLFTKNRNVDVT